MDFEFDPVKNATNLKKHEISLLEGDGVPDDPFVLVIEQEAESGEQRFLGIGRNVFGQIRVVVYTYRGDSIRYISVRKPVPKEVRNYEEGI